MKRSLSILAVAVFATALLGISPVTGHARLGGNFGAGIELGDPTALAGKLWLSDATALDLALGWNTYHNFIYGKGDYVWHDFGLLHVPRGQLPLYYGLGAWSVMGNRALVGVHGVLGLEYLFPSAPLDVFFEVAPGISILPGVDPDVEAGIGLRYFF